MIYNFKVENFYSIREMQELNFEEPQKYDDSVIETPIGKFISTINCIMGNNASGKTNILKALTFFIWFMEDSYHKLPIDGQIPFEKHMLSKDKTTKFEITFDNKNDLFKLELELDNDKIVSEKLGIKTQRSFSKIYAMSRKDNKLEIDHNNKFLSQINKEDRERFEQKKNSSFFSFLINMAYLSKLGLKKITPDINSNVDFMGTSHLNHFYNCIICSHKFATKKEFKKLYLEYINKFDLGITDMSLTKAAMVIVEDSKGDKTEKKVLTFKHGNGEKSFELPIFNESAGTVNALSLLCNFFETFQSGGLLIVDEIESSMHPNIVRKLIGFFGNKTINTNNAQLIFSTHQPLFLSDRLKRQIFLVEKENMVDTEIFRLDEIKPSIRNDENFFMKYLAGEYGAVPNLGV